MKHRCHICGQEIMRDDFFMDYGQGKVCSSCLIATDEPDMMISGLFRQKNEIRTAPPEPEPFMVEQAVQNVG
ncbi:hypothetical protein [Pseudodesulfovibrio senegalensis]|uniref:Uncharacterized protein n=1 Tax=Pseudodesulfovibrio senegalensis TaxID=1721087 RepID=A0A6N6N412_9BACT|nr:hypothetical protein [Pseudodesulfovibrio senegalensis]KAB1442784.1 hypothetical protein F8A88_00470 [Pseudodesulfovibrio senegalensis]